MTFAIRGKPGPDDDLNDIYINIQLFGALQAAILRRVDIVNMSLGIGANSAACEPVPDLPFEWEAENAFDDGILVVASVGNSGPQNTTCTMESPADLIKTLAVAGFDSTFDTGFPGILRCANTSPPGTPGSTVPGAYTASCWRTRIATSAPAPEVLQPSRRRSRRARILRSVSVGSRCVSSAQAGNTARC